jgi:hypothetical protein
MKAIEYTTINEYQTANNLAHNTLKGLENYTSNDYADVDQGILTITNTYLLICVDKFEEQLNEVGLIFTEFNKDVIFKEEMI